MSITSGTQQGGKHLRKEKPPPGNQQADYRKENNRD